jgi:Alginate export
MRCRSTGGIFALAMLSGIASAQIPGTGSEAPALDVEGSVRLRQEAISGQLRAGFNDDDTLTSLRTRILARYGTRGLFAEAELYDSRVYGQNSGTPVGTGEVNAAELVQLSVTANLDLSEGLPAKVQAGRFTLNLGSRRLVAADDYRNTTNGYTGLRADIGDPKKANLTAIYVLPQLRLPEDRRSVDDADIVWDREGAEARLFGIITAFPVAPDGARIEATVLAFQERDTSERQTRDRDLETFGMRYVRDPKAGQFDFDAEAYLQTGTISGSISPLAPSQEVSAAFLHLEAGRQWHGRWSPRLAAEFDYASGDEPGGKYNRFDTLFGMRRAEIAPAGLYNAIGRANLMSPGVRLEVTPSDRLDAFAGLRGLWLAEATDSFSTTGLRDPEGAAGRFVGVQLDSRVRYWLVPKRLRLEANAVFVTHSEFLDETRLPGAPDFTAYGALNLTLQF